MDTVDDVTAREAPTGDSLQRHMMLMLMLMLMIQERKRCTKQLVRKISVDEQQSLIQQTHLAEKYTLN